MHYHPTTVSSLVVRGLINQLGMKDVEELVHKQFPEIDRHTLWESYNIALVVLAVAAKPAAKGAIWTKAACGELAQSRVDAHQAEKKEAGGSRYRRPSELSCGIQGPHEARRSARNMRLQRSRTHRTPREKRALRLSREIDHIRRTGEAVRSTHAWPNLLRRNVA